MEVVGARDAAQEERDYEEYRRQLEGDKEMRKTVSTTRCCLKARASAIAIALLLILSSGH